MLTFKVFLKISDCRLILGHDDKDRYEQFYRRLSISNNIHTVPSANGFKSQRLVDWQMIAAKRYCLQANSSFGKLFKSDIASEVRERVTSHQRCVCVLRAMWMRSNKN